MSFTTLDYLEQANWDGKPMGDGWSGCCPVHLEQHPSFQLRPDRWHPGEWVWICYHEKQVGDLAGLVNIREFGGMNTPQVWHEVFLRCTALGATIPSNEKQFVHVEHLEKPGANEEQRAMLTAVMNWWHHQLWDSPYQTRGQAYYKKRGIALTDLSLYRQIGYAPPTYDERIRTSFFRMLHDQGKRWQETAIALGLLSVKGSIALWDRILFCSVNRQGECVSYQGRSVQLPGDTRPVPYPYIGTKMVQKMPFTLALPDAMYPWSVDVESPVSVAILAPYGIQSTGWQGSPSYGMIRRVMEQTEGPRVIAMDHDILHFYEDGRSYQPGAQHAKRLTDVYEEIARPYQIVLPPLADKDPDTWIARAGIHPFLSQVTL